MNNAKVFRGIFGLIITLIIIAGGLSGNFVLRGTNSSSALVGVMCLFLLYDLYYLYRAFNEDGPTTNNSTANSPKIKAIGSGKTAREFGNNTNTPPEAQNTFVPERIG